MPRLALAVLTMSTVAATPAIGQTCSYDFTKVDEHVQGMIQRLGLKGCSLQITRDQEVIFRRAYGKYSASTAVPIASGTQWISAAVVMSLVDSRLLSLDDTTGQWLGWTGLKGAITVRQLLSHTAGIAVNDAPCLKNQEATLENCARQIESMPLIGPPGGQFAYGSNSLQVAGRICEIAGGEPFTVLFQERLATPLGLHDTYYDSQTNPGVADGVTTILSDYGRFTQMILNRGTFGGIVVLSPQAVDTLSSDQTIGVPVQSLPQCAPPFIGFGLGNWVLSESADGRPMRNASPGAYRFTPWVDRERRITGVLLVMTPKPGAGPSIETLCALVDAAIDAHPEGDLNCDSMVDVTDMFTVLTGWGPCPAAPDHCAADLDSDGEIGVEDLLAVLMNWS